MFKQLRKMRLQKGSVFVQAHVGGGKWQHGGILPDLALKLCAFV